MTLLSRDHESRCHVSQGMRSLQARSLDKDISSALQSAPILLQKFRAVDWQCQYQNLRLQSACTLLVSAFLWSGRALAKGHLTLDTKVSFFACHFVLACLLVGLWTSYRLFGLGDVSRHFLVVVAGSGVLYCRTVLPGWVMHPTQAWSGVLVAW